MRSDKDEWKQFDLWDSRCLPTRALIKELKSSIDSWMLAVLLRYGQSSIEYERFQ